MPSKYGKREDTMHRRCACGGGNPQCPQCGGSGVVEIPRARTIMAGPAAVRRRLPVPQEAVGKSLGPPEPRRCPHCGLDVLDLIAHVAESHPEALQVESAADREAREQEEARQAAVAAEIARREAEAAQRKAEARARRQAIEGPQAADLGVEPPPGRPADANPATPSPPSGSPDGHSSPSSDEAWGRMRQAWAERTVLTGVIRSRRPFGVFIDLGEIEGLVRNREMPAGGPSLREGQPVQVVVIGLREATRQVELSMRRASDPRASRTERGTTGPGPRPAEGPMALAFRLAREKKQQADGATPGDVPPEEPT